MAKVTFDFEKLNKKEKELYTLLPAERRVLFEKRWIAKVSAERDLRDIQVQSKKEARKRTDRNKYILGGLLMKYCGDKSGVKSEWSEEEIKMLEQYFEQYQNALKSAIGKADIAKQDTENESGESKG